MAPAAARGRAVLGGAVDGTPPTGTVTYRFYAGEDCTSPALHTDTQPVGPAGAVPASTATSELGVGPYRLQAGYSGDQNYEAGSSPCVAFAVAAPPRPDAMIRRGRPGRPGSGFRGDGTVNTTGVGQTVATSVRPQGTARFTVRIENDGDVAAPMRLVGSRSNAAYRITYLAGGVDITRRVVAGDYRTATLAPSGASSAVVEVVVAARATAPRGARVVAALRASSPTDPPVGDVVKARVTRT